LPEAQSAILHCTNAGDSDSLSRQLPFVQAGLVKFDRDPIVAEGRPVDRKRPS
jgi:hypothetical protein